MREYRKLKISRIFSTRKLLSCFGFWVLINPTLLSYVSEVGFLYPREIIGNVWKFFFQLTMRCKISLSLTHSCCNAKSVQNKLRISEKNPLATNRCHKSRFSLHRISHVSSCKARGEEREREWKKKLQVVKKRNGNRRNGSQFHFLD